MNIHHEPMLPLDCVIVVQNTVVVAKGPLSPLMFKDDGDGDHGFIEVFLNPASVPRSVFASDCSPPTATATRTGSCTGDASSDPP